MVDVSKVTARQRMIKSKEEIEVEISLICRCKLQVALQVIKLGAATADIGGWACRCHTILGGLQVLKILGGHLQGMELVAGAKACVI